MSPYRAPAPRDPEPKKAVAKPRIRPTLSSDSLEGALLGVALNLSIALFFALAWILLEAPPAGIFGRP